MNNNEKYTMLKTNSQWAIFNNEIKKIHSIWNKRDDAYLTVKDLNRFVKFYERPAKPTKNNKSVLTLVKK